jgi:HrpA-like RNA helicase
VRTFSLTALKQESKYSMQKVSACIIGESTNTHSCSRSMDRVDETLLNYDLIEDILHDICFKEFPVFTPLPLTDSNVKVVGSILIFLPGIGEIRTLMERLSGSRTFGDMNQFDIVPLHSSLSSSEQKRAFITSTHHRRKIILSTNIAETSVTIPDVVYVIDSGRFREITRDRRYDSRKLVVSWCSRASAKQRAGRAGRVQPGVCLKLYSSHTENQIMKSSIEPELQRIPLEEVCLTILASEFDVSCTNFLSQTPQPPSVDAVLSAIHALEAIGAIKAYHPSNAEPTTTQREALTPLGRLLSKLPVDARVGKMLILGSIFNCTDSVLTIAATLSASKSPFATSFEDRKDFHAVHAQFFKPFSDFLTFVNVWNAYNQAESVGAGRKYCQNNKLNYATMIEIQESRCHFLDLLTGLGFTDLFKRGDNGPGWLSSKYNENCECDHLVHAVILAGMFPNIGLYSKNSSKYSSYVLHKSEQLFILSSVNSKLSVPPPSKWIAYSEKFGTESRVSISKTAFIPPISLLLFGSQPQVLHMKRKVCIDDWIELSAAASTAVTFREIQTRLSDFISSLLNDSHKVKHTYILSNNVDSVISCVGKLFHD